MDFETTFFGQLKKPCHALGFCLLCCKKCMVKLLYTYIHVSVVQCNKTVKLEHVYIHFKKNKIKKLLVHATIRTQVIDDQ